MRFDPNVPTQLQRQDWTCAIRSTMWLLASLGIEVTPEEAQGAMSPRWVRSDVGLLNADGSGLVEALGAVWGIRAVNNGAAAFDDVAAVAGVQPVAAGLRNWGLAPDGAPPLGHWSAVRGYDGARLVLANPAGTGGRFGQQTLTRDEFNARGPASMVTIPLDGQADEPPAAELAGIDVSSHQRAVDWAAVAAAGAAFAFTKATGGTWYRNPYFADAWRNIRAEGMVRGAYHYAFETSGQPFPGDGPVAEADYFVRELEAAGGLEAGDLLALDIEDGAGQLGRWCLDWLARVEQLTGVRPFVYTGRWFSDPHGFPATAELAEYPLWLAAYDVDGWPPAPQPWTSAGVTIWQHTARGAMPGVAGPADLNRFRGTRDELLAWGKVGASGDDREVYTVGPGIAAAMAAVGDAPATDELYVNRGSVTAYSEAYGQSGARYVWLPSTGRVARFQATTLH